VVNYRTLTVQNGDINENMFADLNDYEKQRKVVELTEFEIGLKSDLKDPDGLGHNLLFSSTKDIILEWVNVMKQLKFLGVYEKPMETISSYIRNEIGKLEVPLEKKEHLWDYMHKIIPDDCKVDRKPKVNRKNSDLNSSDEAKLTEEQEFLLETIELLSKFFIEMADITKTMASHLRNPLINADMLKYFDKYHKIAALREPIEFMMGKGSILNQISDEQNIRESATVLQLALAKSMEAVLSYRQMAHNFAVSPRQNQRIRKRLEDWPEKDPETIIRKNILSYCCQGCGMNIITGKQYNKNGEKIGEVKLVHKSYPIPEKYKGSPLSPIQIALELAKK